MVYSNSSNGANKQNISGATNSTFTLTAAEVGKYIGVTIKIAEGTNWKAATDSTDYTDATENGTATVQENNYQNVDTTVYYDTLKEALSAVGNNQTIKVIKGITETTAASLASGKTGVKLDLNGKTTTLNGVVLTNSGTLDIYSTVNGGVLQGSGANVIKNSGTLTTNATSSTKEITLLNTSEVASVRVITNDAGKTATLNGNTNLTLTTGMAEGNTTTRYVVTNNGILNIAGATLTNNISGTKYDAGITNTNSAARVVMTSGKIQHMEQQYTIQQEQEQLHRQYQFQEQHQELKYHQQIIMLYIIIMLLEKL